MEGRHINPATAAATSPHTTKIVSRTPLSQYSHSHSRPNSSGYGEAAKERSPDVLALLLMMAVGCLVLSLLVVWVALRICQLNASVKKLSMQQRAAITAFDLNDKAEMIAYGIETQLKHNFDRAMRALRDEQRVLLQRTKTAEDTKPTKFAQPASGGDPFEYQQTFMRPSALASG